MGAVKLQVAIAALVLLLDLWAFWPPPRCGTPHAPVNIAIAAWPLAGCPSTER